MKTAPIALLAIALAAGAASAKDDDARGPGKKDRREMRGRPEFAENGPMAMRGGENRPGGPMNPEMLDEMRAEHRAIRALGEAARLETDEAKKAQLVSQLRDKLSSAAERIQAHQEERLAQAQEQLEGLKERIEYAKTHRDELVEEQLQRILSGERPRGPAGLERHPFAKGGRRGPPADLDSDDLPPPPEEEE